MNPIPSVDQLKQLRDFFDAGSTLSYSFRIEQLKKLKHSILAHEQDLNRALYEDLGKSPEEIWVTETGMVISELNAAIRNLHRWMEPQTAPTNLLNLPSSSKVMKEPLGVVLIIGPWNYPVQLLFNPLVGAIAAGNCIVLKPSEFAPATDSVMRAIIEDAFPKNYALYVQGDGASLIPPMMNDFRFDHVFYTGSTAVGRIIYKLAAEKLVPVTLELGGKSPCIVEADANITVAARRIVGTKFSNSGQMCVAPDYVLVHETKKAELVEALKAALKKFHGENPAASPYLGKMISKKQFDRVSSYLSQGLVIHGGKTDPKNLFIEPSLLTDIPAGTAVMHEEIFGPVLPILSFKSQEEALAIINQNSNPLAFYLFTSSHKKEKDWLSRVQFGGGCVNNAAWHLTNHYLPFGGRGNSGVGNYHGRYSFDVFSHHKAIMKTPTWFDPFIRYPPFKGRLKLFKWIVR